LALDIAAGRGRHSFALAKNGYRVVAVDFSSAACAANAARARIESQPVLPVLGDLANFPIRRSCYDLILNVNFLDRRLFPSTLEGMRPRGFLLVDTYLVDQASIGHPRNPDFLLRRGELRDLMSGLTILEYREGLIRYPKGDRAYRASALARKGD
ncbi:MAG: methyltransferase domain-containing protein, partial [Candidatus Binataceae bacterium]